MDDTSSPEVVYIRKDITSREEKQEDETTIVYYDYQEAKISRADWEYFKNVFDLDNRLAKGLADLDYLAMEVGVDLDDAL